MALRIVLQFINFQKMKLLKPHNNAVSHEPLYSFKMENLGDWEHFPGHQLVNIFTGMVVGVGKNQTWKH